MTDPSPKIDSIQTNGTPVVEPPLINKGNFDINLDSRQKINYFY